MISLFDERSQPWDHLEEAKFERLTYRDKLAIESELEGVNEDLYILAKMKEAFDSAKKRSLKANMKFSLNKESVIKALEKNGKRCWVSGIIFRKKPNGFFRNPFAPSLDRIDSSKGYTPDNTRIVAYCVNAAMNEWGVDVLDHMLGHYKAWAESRPRPYINLEMSLSSYEEWAKWRAK